MDDLQRAQAQRQRRAEFMADVGEELALQAIQFEQLAIRGLQLPADLAFRDTGLKFGALQAFVQIDGKQHGHTRPQQKEGILYRRIQGGRGRSVKEIAAEEIKERAQLT